MDIIKYKNLSVEFPTSKGTIKAVEDVSFNVKKGKILGIVGESGCGKTITAMSLVKLFGDESAKVSGDIFLGDLSLTNLSEKEMTAIRGSEIGIIYQDPLSALNPVYKVGEQIIEGILLHEKVSKKVAKNIALEMLEKVGINDAVKVFDSYPNELSGGMRQRVLIAMALCLKPSILIADEPTTALDVTVQAQILKLLKDINEEFGMTIIVISHDFGVIAEICDDVIVMYGGKVVEEAEVFELFDYPKHPYTKALLAARPTIDFDFDGVRELDIIKGQLPSAYDKPEYCYFYSRCNLATEKCKKSSSPNLCEIGINHKVACYNFELTEDKNE